MAVEYIVLAQCLEREKIELLEESIFIIFCGITNYSNIECVETVNKHLLICSFNVRNLGAVWQGGSGLKSLMRL